MAEMGGSLAGAEVLTVAEEREGQRLDNFLLRECKKTPRDLLYRLIRSGQVRINGRRAKPDSRVASGDRLRLPPVLCGLQKERAARNTVRAEKAARADSEFAPLPVLFEENGFLAVEKPAGLAVHGGSGIAFGVIERLRQKRGDRFLELVHRLDRETSGALLLATKPSALRAAQKLWRERKVEKTYRAALFGEWQKKHRRIALPLRRVRQKDGARMAAVDAAGAEAVTVSRLLSQKRGAAFVRAQILTGRTHQLRAHFAAAGLPIVGDRKYGDFAQNRALARAAPALRRMFLHAERLAFSLPGGGDVIVESPPPPEFAELEEQFN